MNSATTQEMQRITTGTRSVTIGTNEKQPRSVTSSPTSTPEMPPLSKKTIAIIEARRQLALELRGARPTTVTTEMIEFRAMVDGLVDSELKRIRSVTASPVTTPEKSPQVKKHHR